MKKICINFFTLLLMGFTSLQAQIASHEFTVFAGGGFAANCFQPAAKNVSSVGFSSDFGLGFTGFVSQQVGFQIGAGFGTFNIKSKGSSLETIVAGKYKNDNGWDYDLYSSINGYTEIHKSFYLYIPAMVQFQTIMKPSWDWTRTQKSGFYAMGGAKALFLISNRFEAGVKELYNKAYYPDFKNWAATQAFAGLGHIDNDRNGYSTDGKLDFAVIAIVSLEIGMKWRISKTAFLYTGAYYDCGLNDPTKNIREPYSNYATPVNPGNKLQEITLLKVADKLNYMAGGIKVRVAFTFAQ